MKQLLTSIFLFANALFAMQPLATKSKEAQAQFDDALTNFYSYTFSSAYVGFKRAAESDPNLGMAYWGMALARGSMPFNSDEEKKEMSLLVEKALEKSQKAPEWERDYIEALAKRYPKGGKIDDSTSIKAYQDAMEKLYKKYPDDLEAATLYTESLEYKNPEVGVKVLESVLKRNPDHIGANHYYIHTLEVIDPMRALISAHRFFVIKTAAPHILHMPSHLYILFGDYQKTVEANLRAIGHEKEFKAQYGIDFKLPLHYYFFLVRAYMWQENSSKAIETALVMAPINSCAYLESLAYFKKYDEILKYELRANEKEDKVAFWHFAKAISYAAQKNQDLALKEKDLFLKTKPKDDGVLDVAEEVMNAAIAKMNGDDEQQEAFLLKAYEKQKTLPFNEPPNWFYPIKQQLGYLYYSQGNYEKAEKAFREALNELPRNGRSLFGLYHSLKAQNKITYEVENEMKEALQYADHTLEMKD